MDERIASLAEDLYWEVCNMLDVELSVDGETAAAIALATKQAFLEAFKARKA